MRIRTRKLVTWLAVAAMMANTRPSNGDCQLSMQDVNNCGWLLALDCDVIKIVIKVQDCCDLHYRQYVDQNYYDCNDNGTADCEMRTYYPVPDDTCCGCFPNPHRPDCCFILA